MKLSLPYLYRLQTKFAKVMFLHVSVILSTGGGGILACIAGLQTHTQGRKFRGLAGGGSPGPHPWGVGIPACTEAEPPPPQQTATAASGTHPTGMHSCYAYILPKFQENFGSFQGGGNYIFAEQHRKL